MAIPEAAYIQLRRRPPEDEQGNARNMQRILISVLYVNKQEFCASSWKSSRVDLALFVHMTGQLHNLNKELQGKYTVIAEMYNSIKVFKVKRRMRKPKRNCITLSSVHTSLSIDSILSLTKNIPSPPFCFEKSSSTIAGLDNYEAIILFACFTFK